MAGSLRIRYTQEQRADHLLALYQYVLTRLAGDVRGKEWRLSLRNALPWEGDKTAIDFFLPRVVNGASLDGTVDSAWCLFTDPQNTMTRLGLWYVGLDDATVHARPDERGYGQTPWRVQGYPRMMVYLWSENSRIKGQRATVKKADLSTWSRIMQVRLLDWNPQDKESSLILPRRWSRQRGGVYQVLNGFSSVHEFTGMSYEEILADRCARFYQARFDARLESLLRIMTQYKGIEAGKGCSETP